MVKVIYRGRLGNHMFQYALGRYLAEKMSYKLVAEPLPFLKTHEKVVGHSYSHPLEILEGQFCDIPKILANPQSRSIILNGYFQKSQYYIPILDRIKAWYAIDFKTPRELSDVQDSDLLLYIRLGDYFSPMKISLTKIFYETAIEMAAPRKLFIATDGPTHPFINEFKKYKATVLTWKPEGKIMMDFLTARLFNKIAISCSTFSWWAAILSNASEIYFPIDDENGMWRNCKSIDLRIDDKRFVYFYNCPTIKSIRNPSQIVALNIAAPHLVNHHKHSKAFWCD
jgi:hypothetical protein